MDVETLNELKQGVSVMAFIALSKLTDKSARENIVRDGNALQDLIDEAIARQSATSEEVQEAIKQKLTTDAIEYLNKKMKQPFVEKDGERNDI